MNNEILDVVAKILSDELGDLPCNFNDYDIYMINHCGDYCDINCSKCDEIQCWKEWLKAKLKDNGVEV